MKYSFPTDEFISGITGIEEEACQKMIIAGMEWFDQNSSADPLFSGFPALKFPANKDAETLMDVLDQAGGDVDTELLRHTALTHLMYARRNGWLKYIQDMAESKQN